MNPPPPPGMRLLTAEELTKPLPMDAMLWDEHFSTWESSYRRGHIGNSELFYATATPPPTDWRKLVEDQREALLVALPIVRYFTRKNQIHLYKGQWQDPWGAHALLASLEELIPRAKSALEAKP